MNRKFKRKPYRRRKRPIVESLEPRLVLSAAGFACEELADRPDFELQQRNDEARAALVGQRFEDDAPRDRDHQQRRGHFGFRPPRDRGIHRGLRSGLADRDRVERSQPPLVLYLIAMSSMASFFVKTGSTRTL